MKEFMRGSGDIKIRCHICSKENIFSKADFFKGKVLGTISDTVLIMVKGY